MRIVHLSDPHAGGPAEDILAYFDKRWVGVFNYRFRRQFRHDLGLLSNAVKYCLETRPDVVVCTGDLTSTGQPGEFKQTLSILSDLKTSNIPVIYLPGNHDCYVKRPKCVAAVQEAMTFLNGDEYSLDTLPRIRTVGGIDFLMLNTSRPSNLLCSWGFVSREDDQKIQEICARPKLRPRVMVTHYPMLEDHPILRVRHRLFGQQNLLKLLNERQIDVALCGHVHAPYCRVDADGRGENCAGSVTANGGISVITYDETTDKFSFDRVDMKKWRANQ